MSATTRSVGQTDPEPTNEPGERAHWRLLGKGAGIQQPTPLVSVEVDFDRAQSDWLTSEASRTGLNYVALLKKLVDEARNRSA